MKQFPPLLGPGGGRAGPSHTAGLVPEPALRAVQRLAGIVLAAGREISEVEVAGERWSMTPGRHPRVRLAAGAAVLLEAGDAASGGKRSARLTMIGGERLEPPLQVMLRPITASAHGPAAIRPEAAAVTVTGQPLQESGEAVGPPLRLRLTREAAPGAETRPPLTAGPGAKLHPATLPSPAVRVVPPAPPGERLPAAGAQPAEVVSVDAAGRTLIRAGGVMLRIEEPVHLPPAISILVIPSGMADDSTADAISSLPPILRALLQALRPAPGNTALRLPPDAALTLRLLALLEGAGLAPFGEEEARCGAASPQNVLGEVGRPAHEPLPGGWRALQLPFGQENELYPLKLYLRDDPEPGAEREPHEPRRRAGGRGCKRAVFEVEFSRLGRMQLDALCRDQRFDLAVRSPQPLPEALRAEIGALFRAAQEVAGLVGALSFHADALIELPVPSLKACRSLIA